MKQSHLGLSQLSILDPFPGEINLRRDLKYIAGHNSMAHTAGELLTKISLFPPFKAVSGTFSRQ